MSVHPSELDLDRAVLGVPVSAAVASHLRSCPRCAEAVEARRTAESIPGWVEGIRVRPAREARRWPRWGLAVPAAAALAVALVVLPLRPSSSRLEELRAKGAPAIALYVKRGDQVSAWDGRSPVRPGDRLRVGVRGAGYTRLSVASILPSGAPVLLHAGPLSADGETLVPMSFRVDDRGQAEVLSIVLSTQSVDASVHQGAAQALGRDGVWAVRLYLPKETRP